RRSRKQRLRSSALRKRVRHDPRDERRVQPREANDGNRLATHRHRVILDGRRPMKEKREIYRFLHVSPRRIFEQLDQYVVGQRHAKEVLAIAAYNHLKRIEYLKYGGDVSIRKSN